MPGTNYMGHVACICILRKVSISIKDSLMAINTEQNRKVHYIVYQNVNLCLLSDVILQTN